MGKQLEFESIGERTPLGKLCIEYLNLLNAKENLDKELTETKEKIITEMSSLTKKTIKVENYLISVKHNESNSLQVKIKPKE